jgi:ribose transport system permease protein
MAATEQGSVFSGRGSRSADRTIVTRILEQRTVLVLIILCAVISFLVPSFLTINNLLNVLRQVSITGIVAVGMSFVIITGGIDISVGATVALSGVVVALALQSGMDIAPAIALALFAGSLAGAFNGVLIAYIRITPFVATLGTLSALRGLTLIIVDGQAVWGLPEPFIEIGTGYILGIPIPVIIALGIGLGGHILLRRFTFGRHVLAVGGDEDATRLAGVPVKRVKLMTYAMSGLLAGVAGVVLAARLGSGQPSVGVSYELVAIAAAVIGGNALSGGRGTVFGTLIGALILGVVSNALNLWGVAGFYQTVVSGAIVLLAAGADAIRRRGN